MYRLLLRFFPASFRGRFGDDMRALFHDRVAAARRRGWRSVASLYAATIVDVIAHGVAERRRARLGQRRFGGAMMSSLWLDARYGWRFLMRRRGFTLLAVLTLALGIGANTAIFSVVRSVVLQPLPYGDPDGLVMIWRPAGRTETTMLSRREIMQYRQDASSFARLSTYADTTINLTGEPEPERVRAAVVTTDIFETLGVAAAEGRTFLDADTASDGTSSVIILGDGLWKRRFGGAADVIGRTILVNGRARQVVGVMPPSFRLPADYLAERSTEAWIPLAIDPANPGQWGDRSYYGVGRLKPGVPSTASTAELHVIGDRWVQAGYVLDQGDGRFRRHAMPLQEFVTGHVRGPMLVLLGAVGFVLLIACANVVNLVLAQAEARRREVGVRIALGASRRQIVRQVLTENGIVVALGGAAGVAVAALAVQALRTLRPALVPRVEDSSIDLGVLAFTAALSVIAALLAGLVPAWHLSRFRGGAMLHDATRGSGSGRVRTSIRRWLVVGQFAGAVVLVVGAGLLLRTLMALYRVDLGFDPHNVLTAQVQVPQTTYPQPSDVVSFYRRLLERVEAIPGVTAAGAIRLLPLTRPIGNWSITVEGAPFTPADDPNGDFQWVTPGYFAAMDTPIVRGRWLTAADRENADLVVLINETMAARYWPGQEALGRRFKMGTGETPWMTIVGILGATHHDSFREGPRAEMYLPHAQLPQTIGSAPRAMALVIKTTVDPASIAAPLRAVVREIDPNLPVAEIRTMEQIASSALSETHFAAMLLVLFAVLALTLAAIGVYGTVSLLVSERAPEIGLRMALGASRPTVLRLVLRQGLALTGLGIAVGLIAAVLLTRFLRTLVFGVDTLDPLTFAAVPAILVAIAVIACLGPARRAATVDPIVALRS